ncbi:hypothetical protein [Phytomonospora endophytica]|uniref:Uncharacterized protein n=1 Tax=Phytomonospora endophytica TaxID=714109 RepID=A0A841FVM2_9ACTN|nr:hypothetical protein [Phytomonospora endophytica]MBB6037582.1 hypothetical protein [Phytomonospora endophytica]GIG67892.1 hypothetical protein Pen01_41870 [Phytomonospora endophytica]
MGLLAMTGAIAFAALGLTSPAAYAANDVDAARALAEAAAAASAPAPSPAEKSETPAKKKSTELKPVAGLTKTQMRNAIAIIKAGQEAKLSGRAQIIALMTAMQESGLRNLASPVVPKSLKYDHEGTGSDHDSVGLFQQRASGSWGTIKEIMTPRTSALAFYDGLKGVDDWEDMGMGEAAQTVQVSAFPFAYDKHENVARKVVAAYYDN